jgi:sugar-specific transcriptional regulator TrmB
LQLFGLITSDFSRPTRYSAVPAETAIERLVAIHKAKLEQLNNYQGEILESLEKIEPIEIRSLDEEDDGQNKREVSFFHGISGIQHLIREAITGKETKIIANPESIEYILNTIERLKEKPKSCKINLSGKTNGDHVRSLLDDALQLSFENSYIQGRLPTFILTEDQTDVLFYSIEKYKPKPLSATKTRLVMLHALVVKDKTYVEEMHQLFETLWQISMRPLGDRMPR